MHLARRFRRAVSLGLLAFLVLAPSLVTTYAASSAHLCIASDTSPGAALKAFRCLSNHGTDLYAERRYTEAKAPLLEALALANKRGDIAADELISLLTTMTYVEIGLGKYDAARGFAERSLKAAEDTVPADPNRIARQLLVSAAVELHAGQYTKSELMLRKALREARNLAKKDLALEAGALRQLANNLERLGRLEEARKNLSEAIVLLSSQPQENNFELSESLSDLAFVALNQGFVQEAESAAKRALALREDAFGPQHASVAESLSQLAMIYGSVRRYSEGEALYQRAIEISKRLDGPENLRLATYLTNLGQLYSSAGRPKDAIPLLEKAYSVRSRVLGTQHDDTVSARSNLAAGYVEAGIGAKAAPLLQENLRYSEKVFGKRHPQTALAYNNLGALYQRLQENRKAERSFKKALAIVSDSLGLDHPWASTSRQNLAGLYLSEGNWKAAADASTEAAASVIRRLRRSAKLQQEMSSVDELTAAREREVFDWMILSLFAHGRSVKGKTDQITERAFLASQWNAASAAAGAVALMAARQAKPATRLGQIIREREDYITRWQQQNQALTELLGTSRTDFDPARAKALRQVLHEIDLKIAKIDATLITGYPDYAALSRPEPVALPQVQASLREGEAILFYIDTKPVADISSKTFLWLVDRSGATFMPLSSGPEEIAAKIDALRAALGTGGTSRGAVPLEENVAMQEDLDLAYDLYGILISPVADHLSADSTLIVIPSRSLSGLPFQLLLSSRAYAGASDHYQQARWLVRDFAIETLPSVAVLQSLRKVAEPSAASNPYLGIGDPALGRNLVRNPRDCQAVLAQSTTRGDARRGAATTATGRPAEVSHLHDLQALPETAAELCTVAMLLGASDEDVFLGDQATEAQLKALNASGKLAAARILHFATHGLVRGELSGLEEPALVLTPPPVTTPQEDGLLTASEVAELRLDADWVVLSACNTAASLHGDGDLLSGLARAFFYAGARALLVSHWPVDSEAAALLTTGALNELARDPKIGEAQALRLSMLTLIEQGGYRAEPAYWAPFSFVGDARSSN